MADEDPADFAISPTGDLVPAEGPTIAELVDELHARMASALAIPPAILFGQSTPSTGRRGDPGRALILDGEYGVPPMFVPNCRCVAPWAEPWHELARAYVADPVVDAFTRSPQRALVEYRHLVAVHRDAVEARDPRHFELAVQLGQIRDELAVDVAHVEPSTGLLLSRDRRRLGARTTTAADIAWPVSRTPGSIKRRIARQLRAALGDNLDLAGGMFGAMVDVIADQQARLWEQMGQLMLEPLVPLEFEIAAPVHDEIQIRYRLPGAIQQIQISGVVVV